MLFTEWKVKDKEYKLRLNARAIVELEKHLGTNPLNKFIEVANDGTIPALGFIIDVLHAAMTAYNHGITVDDVYDIYDEFVDEGKTLTDLIQVLMEVFKTSGFIKEPKEEETEEPKNA